MLEQPITNSLVMGVSLIAASVLAVKIVGFKLHQLSRESKFDFRPAMLVYNGFWFGVSGAGIPMLLSVTNCGGEFFVNVDRESNELRHIAVKYLCYVYIVTCFCDMGKPFLGMCSTGSVSGLRLAHKAMWSAVVFLAFAMYPTAPLAFAGFVHCLYRVGYYGYLVMTCTSAELQLHSIRRWKMVIECVHFAMFLAIFVHHSFLFYQFRRAHEQIAFMLTASYSGIATVAICRNLTTSKIKTQ